MRGSRPIRRLTACVALLASGCGRVEVRGSPPGVDGERAVLDRVPVEETGDLARRYPQGVALRIRLDGERLEFSSAADDSSSPAAILPTFTPSSDLEDAALRVRRTSEEDADLVLLDAAPSATWESVRVALRTATEGRVGLRRVRFVLRTESSLVRSRDAALDAKVVAKTSTPRPELALSSAPGFPRSAVIVVGDSSILVEGFRGFGRMTDGFDRADEWAHVADAMHRLRAGGAVDVRLSPTPLVPWAFVGRALVVCTEVGWTRVEIGGLAHDFLVRPSLLQPLALPATVLDHEWPAGLAAGLGVAAAGFVMLSRRLGGRGRVRRI